MSKSQNVVVSGFAKRTGIGSFAGETYRVKINVSSELMPRHAFAAMREKGLDSGYVFGRDKQGIIKGYHVKNGRARIMSENELNAHDAEKWLHALCEFTNEYLS